MRVFIEVDAYHNTAHDRPKKLQSTHHNMPTKKKTDVPSSRFFSATATSASVCSSTSRCPLASSRPSSAPPSDAGSTTLRVCGDLGGEGKGPCVNFKGLL